MRQFRVISGADHFGSRSVLDWFISGVRVQIGSSYFGCQFGYGFGSFGSGFGSVLPGLIIGHNVIKFCNYVCS